MANLASNPWTVLPADVVVSSPTALSVNTDGSVNLTTTAPFAGATVGIGVTLINNTPTAYNGFYRILRVTSPTVFVLTPYNNIPLTTGVGTIFVTAEEKFIKLFWIFGLTPIAMPTGEVFVTVG